MATKWKSEFRRLKYYATGHKSEPVSELGALPFVVLPELVKPVMIEDMYEIDNENIEDNDRYFEYMDSVE